MNRADRLLDVDREHHDGPAAASEGTPGKHTLTEHLAGPRRLIAHDVGHGGRNEPDDVAAVQTALARRGYSPGQIDQRVWTRTIAAIRAFQASFLRRPDGLVEVGGPTERRLAAVTDLVRPRPRPPRHSPRRPAAPAAVTTRPPRAAAHAEPPASRPVVGDPKGRIAELHPTVQTMARALLAEARRRGLAVFVAEGMRSIARQNALYAQGRTAPGKVVTWVRGGGSYHNYGLAIDVVFQGGQPWGEQHDWAALGQAGEAAGFEWGGRWKQADRPHFQLPGLTITKLQQWYASGGLDAVWRKVGGDRVASGQPVREVYDETPAKPRPDAPASPAPAARRPARRGDDRVLEAVERYRPFIEEAAARYGVSADDLTAIIAVESKGDPNARAGAKPGSASGLMQVTGETWEHTRATHGELAPYAFEPGWRDPRTNILFGAAILRSKAHSMGTRPGDPSFALQAITAYNAGEGTVKTALALARAAGAEHPERDFLRPDYLKPAIAKHGIHRYYLTGGGRRSNRSGTEKEALDLKYREVVRYVPEVQGYLAQLGGRHDEEAAGEARTPARTEPTERDPTWEQISARFESTIPGCNMFTWHDALWLPSWRRHVRPSDVTNAKLATILENITRQARALQRVRDHLGRPIVVHCWLRPPAYNAEVRGARNSAHLRGTATDFHVEGMTAEAVRQVLRGHKEIYPGAGENRVSWVHLDLEHERWFAP